MSKKQTIDTPWLNTDQATEYLLLPSRDVLYQLTKSGLIPSYRLGERRIRYKRSDLDSAIEAGRLQVQEGDSK